ncbi:GFA family protein [Ramlibacter sp. G-1-2-2]|uniref:GFA family protein n=1 Tax=Ramlibacter agri TaxID=2728837 RepID=A0A848HAJ9_9BURK|nr:GFA family protein [Ramlibacter agri]NML47487.1 GFA family protein [Ramlibacter agri]
MKVTGACHCGQITYEAEVDPERSGICHCTDCQVLTGTAYRVSIPTLPGTFRLLTGKPSVYLKTTADSGARRRHAFCPNCGSPVYASADEDNPSTRGVRVGGLAQREQLAPRRQIWCQSALPWSQDIADLPGVPKQ